MIKTEEELQKKTLLYKFNIFDDVCQRLKEVLMKEWGKLFLIVCAFIKGIQTAIKQERKYNQAIKALSKSRIRIHPSPDVEYIAVHSPLTLYEASEIYPLAQACQVDKYQVAEFAYICEGDVENLKRLLIHKVCI